jgi:hypothetical protein
VNAPAGQNEIDLLTTWKALVRFSSVLTADVRNQRRIWRLISLGLLLFVFFLPLHFHFSPASQLSKECSCAQGTRKQLAVTETAPIGFSQLRAIFFAIPSTSVWIRNYFRRQNVRGPPFIAFL